MEKTDKEIVYGDDSHLTSTFIVCFKEEHEAIEYFGDYESPFYFYFNKNVSIMDNKTYYFFNSESIELGKKYQVTAGQLNIPEEFGFRISSNDICFIVEAIEFDPNKPNTRPPGCKMWCPIGTSSAPPKEQRNSAIPSLPPESKNKIAKKLEAFFYSDHFYLPFFITEDITNNKFWVFLKISIGRYNYFNKLYLDDIISKNTIWKFHQKYQEEYINQTKLLIFTDADIKIEKPKTREEKPTKESDIASSTISTE